MNNFFRFFLCLALCLGGGMLSGMFSSDPAYLWYNGLTKSSLTPPGFVFSIAWTILYVLMAISLYLVWNQNSSRKQKAYFFFYTQLILNFLWTFLFFGLKNPLLGCVDIFLMILAIIGCIKSFSLIHKTSALLFLPLFFWSLFAFYLNIIILINL